MNSNYYPAMRSNTGLSTATSSTTANRALAVGGAAMVIGAASGLAQGIAQAKDGSMNGQQVAVHTAKEALGTGIAVAAGATVASALNMRGFLGVAGMVAVGAAVKYTWDQSMSRDILCKSTLAADEKPAKTTEKKPAPKAAK
ncbi:MAG: hypothetical protein ACOCWR_08760 [Oceanidesulfovibrio sp.]